MDDWSCLKVTYKLDKVEHKLNYFARVYGKKIQHTHLVIHRRALMHHESFLKYTWSSVLNWS